MALQTLIDALVRETSTLVVSVATREGSRVPLRRISDRLFHGLACELHSMHIRRRVAADMFGMAPRAYLRKVRRAEGSVTDHGYSLWQAAYQHIASTPGIELSELARRFHRDDEAVLTGVLSDLRDSGLVSVSGRGANALYVATTGRELGARLAQQRDGSDELVWAVIYREGPLSRETLHQVVGLGEPELAAILQRLKDHGRIYEREKRDRVLLCAASSEPDTDAPESWEAAIFEHFRAAVRALATLLATPTAENTGIGTYTFNLWPGHPLAQDVERLFMKVGADAQALKAQVDAFNARLEGLEGAQRARGAGAAQSATPRRFDRVMLYVGMSEDRPRVIESPSTINPATDADADLELGDEMHAQT